jgi:hypothetical protein
LGVAEGVEGKQYGVYFITSSHYRFILLLVPLPYFPSQQFFMATTHHTSQPVTDDWFFLQSSIICQKPNSKTLFDHDLFQNFLVILVISLGRHMNSQ